MPNINKQITLTSRENSAGPYFDVYYSTDCTNFTICIDGSNVYLPTISSTAIVTVPDTTICIKLVNKNANCNGSFYIDAFGTTTTTTIAPTTTIPPTTTTTTAGVTTTTTLNTQCYEYTYTAIAGCTIFYVDCNGVQQSQFVAAGQTVNLGCIRTYGQSGCGPFTQGTLCATTTTTSTTTLAPTTTTTTLGCYNCGSGVEVFTTGALNYGSYATESVCSTSNECGLFVYNAIDRPNRFNLYDNSGLIGTSGWVGYATWAGPWGASLNVSPSGQFTYDFGTTSGRYVLVEYGPADPESPSSDTAEWSLTCGTCPTTTTTIAPTTTTTTAAFTCFNWTSNRCNSPIDCFIEYYDCNNNLVNQRVNYQDGVTVCSPNAPTVTQGNMNTFTQGSGCGYLPTTTTTTTTIAPTTTTTTTSLFQYNDGGRGNSVAAACSDASNMRTFYSNCSTLTFGIGCTIYIDTFPNPLTGYTNIFINGACWDINSSTGVITGFSSEQC